MIAPNTKKPVVVKTENRSTVLSRNARFMWLVLLFVPPGIAFFAYDVTPHEAIWHDVLYSLLCLPLFGLWLLALLGCVLSFLIHRSVRRA